MIKTLRNIWFVKCYKSGEGHEFIAQHGDFKICADANLTKVAEALKAYAEDSEVNGYDEPVDLEVKFTPPYDLKYEDGSYIIFFELTTSERQRLFEVLTLPRNKFMVEEDHIQPS